MKDTLYSLPKYIKIFESYLGYRIYFVFIFTALSGVADGFGILMLLPLIKNISQDPGNIGNQSDSISIYLNKILTFFNISISIEVILVFIVLIFMIKGVLFFFALRYSAYLGRNLLIQLKNKMFRDFSRMKYKYYSKKDTGYFVNLVNEQINRGLLSYHAITRLGLHIINALVYIIFAFLIAWRFGITALGAGVIIIFIFRSLNLHVRELSRRAAKENGHLSKLLIQTLNAYKYIVTTSQTDRVKKSIFSSIKNLANINMRNELALSFTHAIREPLAVIFVISIIGVQVLILKQDLEPILVSIVLFYRGLGATLNIQGYWQNALSTIGSMELINNEFEEQKRQKENSGSKLIRHFNNKIEFKNVFFSYNEDKKNILSNINFKIPAKTSVAIVGSSGAGKSTIADLITLILKPDKGNIIIDDLREDEIELKSWRKQIGYVSQETVIFDDSIANNICMWSGDAKKDTNLFRKIKEAAMKANIGSYIESLPNGYQTLVGDRGMRLSGGQRQRLFIAREIFRKPRVLILDEATSALDSESEKFIQNSIDKIKRNTTLIIIAHRLSTIKNVDKIYVLDQGQIIEKGNFQSLTNDKNSKFSRLISAQEM